MATRKLHHTQPAGFVFSRDNEAWAHAQIAKYPAGRQASAVIPLLWRAQEQHGWLCEPAIRYVAHMLHMPHIRVLEVATFYTMFQLQPVGKKAHIQICGTTPCMLRGSRDLRAVCERRIASEPHRLSDDGDFSWEEVECLGACVNAPMVQIFKDTYEDLDVARFEALLDAFARGETPKPGPQVDRQFAAPEGGATCLYSNGIGHDGVDGTAPSAPANDDAPGVQPEGISGTRPDDADDLKRIRGIGRVNEEKLHALGIYYFRQIAAWSAAHAQWVNTHLDFPGRIEREEWIEQAGVLAGGGDTAFSQRVDRGEIPTSSEVEE